VINVRFGSIADVQRLYEPAAFTLQQSVASAVSILEQAYEARSVRIIALR
jgi:hypothetical protein